MPRFELELSGVGSDRSVNCATALNRCHIWQQRSAFRIPTPLRIPSHMVSAILLIIMFSYFEWKDKERVDRKLVSHLITIWRKYLNCLLSYNFPFWYAQKLANVSMALFVWVIFMYRFNYISTYLIHHQQVRSEISNCFNSPLQMSNHYVLLLLPTWYIINR